LCKFFASPQKDLAHQPEEYLLKWRRNKVGISSSQHQQRTKENYRRGEMVLQLVFKEKQLACSVPEQHIGQAYALGILLSWGMFFCKMQIIGVQ
jgi:hypothetical protein